jgi:LPS-assembly lipoprotein
MIRSMVRAFSLLRYCLPVTAMLLAACGWRLQGDARVPESMRSLRISTGDTYSDFYRELRERLLAAGAQLQTVESRPPIPEQAATTGAVMVIHSDEAGQRVLSVSARNTPEEYEVYYRIEYSLQIAGAELIPRQQVELTRAYSYDARAVLAKQREQFVLQQALARELVSMVLRRMNSVSTRGALAQVPGQDIAASTFR